MPEEHLTLSDGCRLWTSAAGAGPPVVFVHGGPGLWDTFADLAGPLSSAFTTYRWDQRGCGRSAHQGPYSLARTMDDLDELRDHFGHERVFLVGHSWGADLALYYALARPRHVGGLVYLSGTGLGPPRPVGRRRLREVMAPHQERIDALLRAPSSPERDSQLLVWRTSFGFADQDRARERAERVFTPRFPYNQALGDELLAQTARYAEGRDATAIQQLKVPTLVLHGAADMQPPEVTDGLLDLLPDVRRTVVEDAGHYPWAERPAETVAAVRAFLTGLV